MFSNLFYRLFHITTKLGYFLGLTSYKFFLKTNRCILSKHALKKQLAVCLLLSFITFYMCLATWFVKWKYGASNEHINVTINISIIFAIVCFAITIGIWNFYYHQKGSVEVLNHVFNYCTLFHCKS